MARDSSAFTIPPNTAPHSPSLMPLPAPDAIAPAPIGLGFGGNVGDPAGNIRRALADIEARGIARITACSSVWRTAPWGYTQQEDFANLCALAETRLSPAE